MGVIAELLKQVPGAEQHRAQLEALENEIERLRAENETLKMELARTIDRWETLDGDALETLLYLSRYGEGRPADIAQANRVNPQIVEAYLKQLLAGDYVQRRGEAAAAQFALAPKGRWYLKERGLLKLA